MKFSPLLKEDSFAKILSVQLAEQKISEVLMEAEGGSDKMSNFNDTDSEEDELQSHSTKLDTQLA